MRARQPDVEGVVERDGITLGYEVFGEHLGVDGPTVLLLPTWTIIHARFWKLQVPYLARHYRVVVYDGPGNGRSGRTTDPSRYTFDAYAADAAAVLDECGVERAVAVGVSLGVPYGLRLAGLRPGSRGRTRARRWRPPARQAVLTPVQRRPLPRPGAAVADRLGSLQPRLLARQLRRVRHLVLRAGALRAPLDQGARGRRRVGAGVGTRAHRGRGVQAAAAPSRGQACSTA